MQYGVQRLINLAPISGEIHGIKRILSVLWQVLWAQILPAESHKEPHGTQEIRLQLLPEGQVSQKWSVYIP